MTVCGETQIWTFMWVQTTLSVDSQAVNNLSTMNVWVDDAEMASQDIGTEECLPVPAVETFTFQKDVLLYTVIYSPWTIPVWLWDT